MRILSSKNAVLVDSSATFALIGKVVALELPTDDQYTISINRPTDASTSDVGDFTLYLAHPQELSAGQPVTDNLDNPHDNYYLVHESDQAFTLTYRLLSGTVRPDIDVNEIQDGGLNEMIEMRGDNLTEGKVLLPADADLLITVGGLFKIDPEKPTGSYQIIVS